MPTIIVIEDDDYMRDDILDILELEGFTAIGAGDGTAGLQFVRQHKPNLIICDIWMPGIDGFEVLKQIRADTDLHHTPFLFLTANSGQEFMDKGKALGSNGFIIKPIRVEQLIKTITQYLEAK